MGFTDPNITISEKFYFFSLTKRSPRGKRGCSLPVGRSEFFRKQSGMSGESARVGEIQIARHSDCEDDLVGLQEPSWQAALSNAKAWQTGD